MGHQPMSLVALQSSADQSDCLERYRITLAICQECSHVHNIHFNPNYPNYSAGCHMYNSGLEWQAHMRRVKFAAESTLADTVIEIGAGDCQFLDSIKVESGWKDQPVVKIAVDPAHSSAEAAEELGIHHVREKFCAAEHIPDGAERVLLIMRHLLEHMEQPRDFIESIVLRGHKRKHVTNILIEVPNCEKALRDTRIEDWTYEHAQHFTATSLEIMLRHCGFQHVHVEKSYDGEVLIAEAGMSPQERKVIPDTVDRYAKAQRNIEHERIWILENLDQIAFWGGAGKSAMFIRKFRLPENTVVVDSHETKWGMYVPGTRIPIRNPKVITEPNYIVATTSWRAEDIAREIVRDAIPCRALLKFVNGEFVEVPLG
jgi:hypothetical protein